MSESTVEKDLVVQIHYVLSDDEGNVLDTSGGQPLSYLHGHGNILPGLEEALEGHAVGDAFDVTVPPEKGYGEVKPNATESVHRRDLPKGARLEPGAPIRLEGSEGKAVTLWITRVQGARVTLTANHPLAGKTLQFHVEVAGTRRATSEELAHGHAHEPGQHHH